MVPNPSCHVPIIVEAAPAKRSSVGIFGCVIDMDLFAWICLLIAYLSIDLMNLNPNPQGLYCLRFAPTDVEVIDQFLVPRHQHLLNLNRSLIRPFNFFRTAPQQLNLEATWKRSGKPENIVSGGIMLGTKQLFKFLYTDPTTSKPANLKTGWSLYEYAIPDPPLPQTPTDDILPVEPTVVVNVFYNFSDDEYHRSGLAVPEEPVQVVEAEDNGGDAQGQEGHVEEDNGGATQGQEGHVEEDNGGVAQGQEGHVEEDNDNNNNVVNDDEDVFANLAPIANIPNNI
ncbi:hypothetical protein DY000_02038160 [Brassica cretica]|uniref:NAC domain-containing protein n=1 Tax=Brassica cretica TaxID=69181 RepID=A0ABQ7BPI0_BRACR|nr:hypothetical protein DY000_02038160 [Brassica cretica]